MNTSYHAIQQTIQLLFKVMREYIRLIYSSILEIAQKKTLSLFNAPFCFQCIFKKSPGILTCQENDESITLV